MGTRLPYRSGPRRPLVWAALLVLGLSACSPAGTTRHNELEAFSNWSPARVANAARVAIVKAEEEAAHNPLVRVFGSEVQRQADAARLYLARAPSALRTRAKAASLAKRSRVVLSTAPKRVQTWSRKMPVRTLAKASGRITSGPPSGRGGVARATSAAAPRAPSPSVGARSDKAAPKIVETSRANVRSGEKPARHISADRTVPATGSKVAATTGSNEATRASRAGPAIDLVVFDAASGIKTIHLADGTVAEEPFDPAALPSITAALGATPVKVINAESPVSDTSETGPKAQTSAPAR